jgi:hypothetical protein
MKGFLERLERTMAAAAFAEAGDADTCRQIMSSKETARQRKRHQAREEAPRPRPQLRAPSMKD